VKKMNKYTTKKQEKFKRMTNSVQRDISGRVNELYNSLILDYQHRKEYYEEERDREETFHNINCSDYPHVNPVFMNREESVAELAGYIIGSYERLRDVARTLNLSYVAPFSDEEIKERLEHMRESAERISELPRVNLLEVLIKHPPKIRSKKEASELGNVLAKVYSQKPKYSLF
jgi:hypothetical protein